VYRGASGETDPVTTDQRNVGKEAAVARIHQPDQSVFRSILPEDIDWKPMAARLYVSLPGMERATAQRLVEAAHQVCPYSRATHGNIAVETTLV